jgi:hypothetical protein
MIMQPKVFLRILAFLLSTTLGALGIVPQHEVFIVGGGIAGALHAYNVHRDAVKYGTDVCVTIFEKNSSVDVTTTANIVPSLTPDEILSVVPRGKALVEKLQIPFSQPGGIRVDDVENVNNATADRFMREAECYSKDEVGYEKRTKALLSLGKMSMDLWQAIYDDADAVLKTILIDSNFNPCRPMSGNGGKALHDGYRIDLIYTVPNAMDRAQGMKSDYESLGYTECAILSPTEVMAIDPFLSDFCREHTTADVAGVLQWNNDSVALWRPGGCIDTKTFLPKFYDYLKKAMGTYVDNSGKQHDRFNILYDKEVVSVQQTTNGEITCITGLRFSDNDCLHNDPSCTSSSYIFCPGEAVGMLSKFGFKEPAYARFAGASLLLNIPVPQNKINDYKAFNHCMEVHQEGVVLAWQARFVNGMIFIGVAGTKAFYGDQLPTKDQAFAKNRNLLQLNMINNVLPEFISLALGRNTKGSVLTQADMDILEQKQIAKRWAGTRAVAFDGFPTLGVVYTTDGKQISNAIVTTHLGSGGASFGPAAVVVSCSGYNKNTKKDPLLNTVLDFAESNRSAA